MDFRKSMIFIYDRHKLDPLFNMLCKRELHIGLTGQSSGISKKKKKEFKRKIYMFMLPLFMMLAKEVQFPPN